METTQLDRRPFVPFRPEKPYNPPKPKPSKVRRGKAVTVCIVIACDCYGMLGPLIYSLLEVI